MILDDETRPNSNLLEYIEETKKSPSIIKSKKAFFLRLCSNFIEFHSFVFVVSLFAIN